MYTRIYPREIREKVIVLLFQKIIVVANITYDLIRGFKTKQKKVNYQDNYISESLPNLAFLGVFSSMLTVNAFIP